jgi:hypothetical protein
MTLALQSNLLSFVSTRNGFPLIRTTVLLSSVIFVSTPCATPNNNIYHVKNRFSVRCSQTKRVAFKPAKRKFAVEDGGNSQFLVGQLDLSGAERKQIANVAYLSSGWHKARLGRMTPTTVSKSVQIIKQLPARFRPHQHVTLVELKRLVRLQL